MQALGLIETKGLIAAVEAADVMVKSADVSIIEKTYVGGGLVTILVTGDVGAVKASVEAGVAAVKKLDETFLVSEHVIPRPHYDVESIIGPNNSPKGSKRMSNEEENEDIESLHEEPKEIVKEVVQEEQVEETIVQEEIEIKSDNNDDLEKSNEKPKLDIEPDKLHKLNLQNLHKEDVDNLVKTKGIDKTISVLTKLKVVKLRNLAREYKDFVITGRAISKADKNSLITKFKLYYDKN